MKTSLTSLRLILLLLGFAVFTAACLPFVGDGNGDDATPTPDEIPTIIRPSPDSAQPASSPIPTIVPLPTQGPQPTSPAPACTPRNDWPVYTVESGDTLYSIAVRSDTADDVLQAANCLPDPNKISVGQSLRVPKQPEPREPAATPEPAATQQPFFQGTPAPGTTGDVEFTIIVQENTATLVSQGSFQAQTSDGDVKLGISVSNVTSFEVVRGDGRVLHRGQVVSGSTTAGGNYSFKKVDRAEGSNFLIFTIKALKQDGTTVEGNPVYIRWP